MFYAFIFSFMCFILTTSGAVSVFFVNKNKQNLKSKLYALSSGIMLASSIFSLIIPAVEYCDLLKLNQIIVLPLCLIFAFIFVYFLNKIEKFNDQKINVLSLGVGMGLHNVAEGMCVGFAFASWALLGTSESFMSAIMIAVGIGIQNMPEGSAMALPLNSYGYTKTKSFLISLLVAFVEVPAGVLAYVIGLNCIVILPYMLMFSACIMIFSVVCDLMPEALSLNKKTPIVYFFLGFLIMMFLDISLG